MPADSLLRRFLEQRRDLGETELVFDTLTAAAAVRALGSVPPSPAAAAAPASRPHALERDAASIATSAPSGDWRTALGGDEATRAPFAAGTPPIEPVAVPGKGSTGRLVVGSSAGELFGGPLADVDSLDAIATLVRECTRCPLYKSAANGVPGEGSAGARLVCVGEAPGANEDATGRPFVGQAGQLLTKILGAVKLKREDVFILNVLKHRPPENRDPLPQEVDACRPYLERQLELIAPRVIVAFGTFAAQTLLETKLSLGKLRGQVHRYRGIPLVVTYHPAALLRNDAWKRPTWEDVQLARRILDGGVA
ncbi:MAG: uracil-DNA glycosylase [Gemmatimonadaceae bacterium]